MVVWKTLPKLLIFVATCQIVVKTNSQQCPAFGSEESILGWMLQGHIYQTMMANIGLHCLSACFKDDRCQSFNFVMSLQMCEFSDRTKEARPEDFIADADRHYFRKYIKRAQLGSISELAAESCKEIKMSEGRASNGKYWMSSIKPGIPVHAFCDMKTEDVDECTASSSVCHENAACNNTLGSYQCTCKRGYAGDGKICSNLNKHIRCEHYRVIAAVLTRPFPSFMGTFYSQWLTQQRVLASRTRSRVHFHVDECTASSPVCHVNATCNNAIGSYQCTCKPGYAGDGKACRVLTALSL
ncbi:fibrillin-2-like [Montipora foliosa]|uniref:fibrillin-2-like n=1 Tax=Montipora foliosa TaxID=591990 RepID=UPI0035F202D2